MGKVALSSDIGLEALDDVTSNERDGTKKWTAFEQGRVDWTFVTQQRLRIADLDQFAERCWGNGIDGSAD